MIYQMINVLIINIQIVLMIRIVMDIHHQIIHIIVKCSIKNVIKLKLGILVYHLMIHKNYVNIQFIVVSMKILNVDQKLVVTFKIHMNVII